MYLKPIRSPRSRVLIVDDDAASRAAIGKALAPRGFSALHAASGRHAGVILEAHSIDLVIADVFMPEHDGSELIAAIRRMAQVVPVIALSDREAWNGLGFLDAANDLGAAAVLQKPFGVGALVKLVIQLMTKAKGGVEAPEADCVPDDAGPWGFIDWNAFSAGVY